MLSSTHFGRRLLLVTGAGVSISCGRLSGGEADGGRSEEVWGGAQLSSQLRILLIVILTRRVWAVLFIQ